MLRTRVSLADVYRAQGDYEKALDYYESSVAAFERTIGINHPCAADALCGLAESLAHVGQLERADEYFRAARTNLVAQKFADRLAPVAECLEGYAALLRKRGQGADADAIASKAIGIRTYLRAARLAVTEQ